MLLDRVLERADTDNDGALSRQEIEAFQDKMTDRPGFGPR
jgi:hypothetical protein